MKKSEILPVIWVVSRLTKGLTKVYFRAYNYIAWLCASGKLLFPLEWRTVRVREAFVRQQLPREAMLTLFSGSK